MNTGMRAYVEYDLARSEKSSVTPAEKEFVIRKPDTRMELAKGFGDSNRWIQSDIPSQRISRVLSKLSHSPIRNSPARQALMHLGLSPPSRLASKRDKPSLRCSRADIAPKKILAASSQVVIWW